MLTLYGLVFLIFLADLLLNFLTSYYSQEGDEIQDYSKIATHYLKRLFVLDLICLIPFEIIGLSWLQFISLIKMIRFLKIRRFLSKIAVSKVCKQLIKLILLVLFFACFHHFFACIWSTF